ncbi:putative F-box protein [Iris pallida]|uniref:F-box protein n=1 Tax=Iris pallida TaxID=29817 RepID=A0AAX6ILB4_IRIPA|nr:putative F-box protein [Iris pallida]
MALSTGATSTTTIEDLHPDVLAGALRRMDGPTLAAVGCSTSLFRSLSADPSIWADLCLEAWPSLRLLPTFASLSPRSIFADTFPFPDTDTITHTVSSSFNNAEPSSPSTEKLSLPDRVFSAVDIHYEGVPIFSRIAETNVSCPWFLGSVFRIDALDRKDPPAPSKPMPAAINPAGLELSWAVIDAGTGRAVNVSSRRPVAVDRHWYTGEALVRFVTVLSGCTVSVVVTCGEEAGHVREVTMTVEDVDGIAVSGKESLGILTAAMQGRKKRKGNGEEEEQAKRRYEDYLKKKRMRKERKVRREGILDLCCTGFGALVFLAFLMLLAFK